MSKQLTLEFMDKEYILEFNRKTTMDTGVSVEQLQRLADEPLDSLEIIPKLWSNAFMMHHPSCPQETKDMIYDAIGDKEGLIEALTELYLYPLEALFGQEQTKGKNLKWKKNWK